MKFLYMRSAVRCNQELFAPGIHSTRRLVNGQKEMAVKMTKVGQSTGLFMLLAASGVERQFPVDGILETENLECFLSFFAPELGMLSFFLCTFIQRLKWQYLHHWEEKTESLIVNDLLIIYIYIIYIFPYSQAVHENAACHFDTYLFLVPQHYQQLWKVAWDIPYSTLGEHILSLNAYGPCCPPHVFICGYGCLYQLCSGLREDSFTAAEMGHSPQSGGSSRQAVVDEDAFILVM